MKILRVIFEIGELNTSDIARRVKVNYESANKSLRILEEEGVLHRKVFGRINLYRFNEHSSKANAVRHLIETWEQANNKKDP